MIDRALLSLVPGCQFTLLGDDVSGLTWLDERPRPSDAEILAEAARIAGLPVVPSSVKMWQAKIALSQSGKLDAANAAIAAANNAALQIAWEYASDLSRSSPGMAAIAQAIDLSAADVDQLFIAAAQIQV